MLLQKLYSKQISLSEWFEQINHSETEAMRIEDNDKRERLGVLNMTIHLPFDKPYQFKAIDIASETDAFKTFLTEHGDEPCALRLMPLKEGLPKLRMRGCTIRDVTSGWFKEQKINPADYRADYVPHPLSNIWSTIFIVNKNGIFGEITKAGHHELTQGIFTEQPIIFQYDFKNWKLSTPDSEAEKHLVFLIKHLLVDKENIQHELNKKLNAVFSHNYLCGYFETVFSKEFSLHFIDYNRILGNMYGDYATQNYISSNTTKTVVTGFVGCPGKVTGTVRIVPQEDIVTSKLNSDEILVCDMTTPEYLQLMKQSCGIITDRGGILSHAAIVSRELQKPCIVGTNNATKILKNGDIVELDAQNGIVILR